MFERPSSLEACEAIKLDPVAPPDPSLESLTIVTMNLAGCEPSRSAPRHWNKQRSIDAVKIELLKQNPDILALQECPGGVEWAVQVFPEYEAIGARYSHADQVVLLVKRGIVTKNIPLSPNLPAVMASLEWKNRGLLVASVHLAPFAGGSFRRKDQVQELLQKASSMSVPLMIAGDTNMRETEDAVMERDLNLLDVWKLAGSHPGTKWTWDTIDHRKHGGSFNQYYGKDTRQYQTRYDRIYVSTTNTVMDVKEISSFELVGSQPITSKVHFLSDHFGMSAAIKLKWDQ